MLHFYVIWAKKIEKWSTMKRNSGIFALKSLDYSLPYAMLMQKPYAAAALSPTTFVE